jgi:thiol:disulfide interchange protein DsbD
MHDSVFTDPRIEKELVSWNLLRFDATESSEQVKKKLNQFSVDSLPTVVFFDSKGREKSSLRSRGAEGPDIFFSKIQLIKSEFQNSIQTEKKKSD